MAECAFCLNDAPEGAEFCGDDCREKYTDLFGPPPEDALEDEAVIAEVTRVKGVGRWTAEMFLLFSLARPDVLALDDGGLLRAAGWALELGRPATGAELATAGEAWRPYRSVASLYLWACLDRRLVPRNGAPGGLTPRETAAD